MGSKNQVTECPFYSSDVLLLFYRFGVFTDQFYVHLLIKNSYLQTEILQSASDRNFAAALDAYLGDIKDDIQQIRLDLGSFKEPKTTTLEALTALVEGMGFAKEEAEGKTTYNKKVTTGTIRVTITNYETEVAVRADMQFEADKVLKGLRLTQELTVLLENSFDEEGKVKAMLTKFEDKANKGLAFV
jgi:hypothetical protein